jgi:drug/metabolite transporter (DMT)-like permease
MDSWLRLSFFVLSLLAFQDILHRFLMKEGFNAVEIVMYGMVPSVIVGGIYMYIVNQPSFKKPTKLHAFLFIFSGILTFYGFLIQREAQLNSPNMGYVNSILYSSALVTIILTSIIFKDKLHWQGVLGSICIIIGLGLISSIKSDHHIT